MAPLRRDGTLRKPVTIWVVRLGDYLYIRSVYGRTPSWFRAAQVRHEGHRREALAWCAAPTTAMTHIAIQEGFNGKTVDWMEKVSDEQYRAK